MLAPATLLIFFVFIFPMLYTAWMSLHDYSIVVTQPADFIGLQNYVSTVESERFVNAVGVTLYNLGIVVSGALLLGFVSALLYQHDFLGRAVARTLAVLPMMVTPAALALMMIPMYHPTLGVLNYLLSRIGVPPLLWTYDERSVIPALGLIQVWQYTPLAMLFLLGGLAALPIEPQEAALVDGASWWQRLRYITLPMLRPHAVLAAIILTIDIMKSFEVIFIMTGGGPGTASETLNLLLYKTAFTYYRTGEAAALGLMFVGIILAFVIILVRVRRSDL
jgi:multiple sugar transport system permease protein